MTTESFTNCNSWTISVEQFTISEYELVQNDLFILERINFRGNWFYQVVEEIIIKSKATNTSASLILEMPWGSTGDFRHPTFNKELCLQVINVIDYFNSIHTLTGIKMVHSLDRKGTNNQGVAFHNDIASSLSSDRNSLINNFQLVQELISRGMIIGNDESLTSEQKIHFYHFQTRYIRKLLLQNRNSWYVSCFLNELFLKKYSCFMRNLPNQRI